MQTSGPCRFRTFANDAEHQAACERRGNSWIKPPSKRRRLVRGAYPSALLMPPAR